jgi:hypothetical protein
MLQKCAQLIPRIKLPPEEWFSDKCSTNYIGIKSVRELFIHPVFLYLRIYTGIVQNKFF